VSATEASALFDVVGEGAPVGLAFVDTELRFVRINAALAAINGRPVAHHLGRRIDEALPELADELLPILRHVLATGEPVLERELTGEIPGTGRVRHVLASWFPVRVEDQITGVGAVVVDITERKAAELRLEGVLRQLPVGVVIADADGRSVLRNGRLEEIGLPVPRPGARVVETDFVAWHPDGRAYEVDEWPLIRSLERGDVVRGEEMEYRDPTGARRVIEASSAPIREAGGAIVAAVVVIQEVTERRRAAERQELLVRAGEVLDSALSVDERLDRLARHLVPRLADYVKIELLEDRGGRRPVAIAHQDPEREALMRAWRQRGRMGEHESVGMATTFATGEAKLLAELATEAVVRAAREYTGEEGAELMRAIGPRSQIVVPLRARGRVLGALSLTMAESGRRYAEEDLDLARDLGLRAGVAVDNARLYEEEQRRARQLDALTAASLAIHTTRDLRGRLRLAADHARALLGAQRAVATIRVGDERLAATAPGSPAMEADAVAGERSSESVAARRSAPLIARRGSQMGQIEAFAEPGGEFVPGADMLLGELARIASLALENARLDERARHIAHTLQASLLPPSLPEIPGLEVAARYLAGGEGTTVGGDLYDLFPVDGDWALVLGDVCGKGAEAAALTSMVRFTIRAEVVHHESPGEVLGLLNAAILRQYRDVRFCTVLHGRLRAGGRLTLASAGHPPPLLRRADGTVEAVPCTGPLLGVLRDVEHPDVSVELRPGDVLVSYTDGVTEGRGPEGLFGDERLADLLAASGDDVEAIADRITAAVLDFQGGRTKDDLALLVLRVPRS
jgi:PAS domain S-box-containing protein